MKKIILNFAKKRRRSRKNHILVRAKRLYSIVRFVNYKNYTCGFEQ